MDVCHSTVDNGQHTFIHILRRYRFHRHGAIHDCSIAVIGTVSGSSEYEDDIWSAGGSHSNVYRSSSSDPPVYGSTLPTPTRMETGLCLDELWYGIS